MAKVPLRLIHERQKQEMPEVISDVYDIAQPTPVSLQKLSAITISLEIWRREVNEYRKSDTLASLAPDSLRIPLESVLPGLPSVCYNIIYKYVKRFGFSMNNWASYHYDKRIFGSGFRRRMNVLKDFDDFVCDYDGAVHYVRTAERMMRCDGFDDVMKFNIACTYFFEEDIKRMWPFVSKSMDIDSIDFRRYPHMYYWICRLTNKLDKIRPTRGNVTIDEEMIDRHIPHNMASLEYFWNGVSRENQIRRARWIYDIDLKSFIRIIFPKLDNQQLAELINERSRCSANEFLRIKEWIDEELVLGTWLYIRNVMSESKFKFLVVDMVKNQYRKMKYDFKDNTADCDEYNADVLEYRSEYTYLCCEIWSNCPANLKSSVIRDLLPGTTLLEKVDTTGDFHSTHINAELLLLILRSASFEARSSFWNNCWHLLIAAARGEDLQRIMKLCFETKEHEMAEFKEIIARSENVRRLCVKFLREGKYFDHLNELVSFICPEMPNARNFKQQILRSCLSHRSEWGRCRLELWIVLYAGKLNDFITSAYDDVDSSVDLKNQLMPSASVIEEDLCSLILDELVSVQQLIAFLDSFVSKEETVVQIKMSIIDSFKEYVTDTACRSNQDIMGKPFFNSILLLCLGSYEEVDKFKLTCSS